jgi:hypothetical protein
MKMPAIMFACAIEELEEAVDNKRPISSLMKQKWIDDAGGFVGDCETLLRLFRSESTDAWERKIAAYYLAVYEEEQHMMRRRLEEAVAAFREALKEGMRERVPLQWATAQNNLEIALKLLGAASSWLEFPHR